MFDGYEAGIQLFLMQNLSAVRQQIVLLIFCYYLNKCTLLAF